MGAPRKGPKITNANQGAEPILIDATPPDSPDSAKEPHGQAQRKRGIGATDTKYSFPDVTWQMARPSEGNKNSSPKCVREEGPPEYRPEDRKKLPAPTESDKQELRNCVALEILLRPNCASKGYYRLSFNKFGARAPELRDSFGCSGLMQVALKACTEYTLPPDAQTTQPRWSDTKNPKCESATGGKPNPRTS